MDKGILLVSLDFELFWGMQDGSTIEGYGPNILGGKKAIPALLELFKKYGIHCSWATVGMMFAKDISELREYLPEKIVQPTYEHEILSSYRIIDEIGTDNYPEEYFFANDLINQVRNTPNQEIGSHTFSHYYARENGQTLEQLDADLACAVKIAQDNGVNLKTVVFPRNQSTSESEKILIKNGFVAYRGEEEDWIHRIKTNKIKRMFRLMDSYVNITGSDTYSVDEIRNHKIYNFRGSRFIRPYSHSLRFFEGLKLRRVKGQMKAAAKKGRIVHIWWHPHNIGINTQRNLKNIEEILRYYKVLETKYGMKSMNMSELSVEIGG